MEYLFIYLLQIADVLDDIQCFFIISSIISIIFWIAMMCVAFDQNKFYEPDEEDKEYKTVLYQNYLFRTMLKKIAIFCVAVSIILSLIPTKQTLLLAGGTYLAKKTISSDKVNAKLSKIDTIIDIQLDKYLKELQQKSLKTGE